MQYEEWNWHVQHAPLYGQWSSSQVTSSGSHFWSVILAAHKLHGESPDLADFCGVRTTPVCFKVATGLLLTSCVLPTALWLCVLLIMVRTCVSAGLCLAWLVSLWFVLAAEPASLRSDSLSLCSTDVLPVWFQHRTGQPDFPMSNVSAQQIPKSAFTAFNTTMQIITAIYFVMAYAPFVSFLLVNLVTEKEKKIREAMRMMGMRDSAFW